ncbi:hypothetical protein FDENT_13598 [Fusarium denticulatum]|uniref:Uncharacterized protein n=1 Tax=Fusarium denticulatum TaxID=48507 RepID=A0A8H5WJQ0_9HYPO|nr:hypothetical protein FDENT_13598 [Fusarium denticulatum]
MSALPEKLFTITSTFTTSYTSILLIQNVFNMVQLKTFLLPLALVALSSTVSGSPIAGNDAIQPTDDLPGTSGWKSISLSLEERISPADGAVLPRDEASLEKRVFTSPHMKRAFRAVIANTISAATWVIDFSIKEIASSQVTLNYKLQSSQGITQADVDVLSITRIYESDNQFRGNAKMELLGKYAGKVVHIWFNGEVFGSGAEMIWQRMISEPVCYVNGVKTEIKSWTFEQVYP